jgi:putative MATE family efflux protein
VSDPDKADPDKADPDKAKVGARFTTGSTMNHVVVMTFTSAIGLMAMFLVDLIDLWFITMLGIIEATAAIGFAGTIVFSNLSVGLGMSIAGGALVAQALGRSDEDGARQAASSTLVLSLATGVIVAILVGLFARPLLGLLGASGETQEIARSYLLVILPGFALLAGAITLSFTLRALGDPKRAMYVTLTTAAANAVLDPIFIFGLGLGVEGAALATVCANLASFMVGFHCLQKHHNFLVMPTTQSIREVLRPLSRIAFPAIATQLATPFSIAYLTAVTAQFGTDAVAGVAVINRLIPVAFGIIFSLSGAVGPVVGQNYGAGHLDRVRQTLLDGFKFSTAYTIIISVIMLAVAGQLPAWFNVTEQAGELVTYYYTFIAITWAFAGMQFVSQAAFNNLDKASWSMWFNWGKVTIGTIPLLHLGANLAGAKGALVAMGAANVIFGIAAAATALWLVKVLDARHTSYGETARP